MGRLFHFRFRNGFPLIVLLLTLVFDLPPDSFLVDAPSAETEYAFHIRDLYDVMSWTSNSSQADEFDSSLSRPPSSQVWLLRVRSLSPYVDLEAYRSTEVTSLGQSA
jgi:hypothetical protein